LIVAVGVRAGVTSAIAKVLERSHVFVSFSLPVRKAFSARTAPSAGANEAAINAPVAPRKRRVLLREALEDRWPAEQGGEPPLWNSIDPTGNEPGISIHYHRPGSRGKRKRKILAFGLRRRRLTRGPKTKTLTPHRGSTSFAGLRPSCRPPEQFWRLSGQNAQTLRAIEQTIFMVSRLSP
jgi:hypothetical protein